MKTSFKAILVVFVAFLPVFLFAKTPVLHLAAASNLNTVLPSLIKAFNQENPNIKVKISLNSSAILVSQINAKAPFGVFLSADKSFADIVHEKGLSLAKPRLYASGQLAVFSTKKINYTSDLSFLLDEKIKKIAIANPSLAPYGNAAKTAMTNAKIYDKIHKKLILSTSISGALNYGLTSVNVAFVAASSLKATRLKKYKLNQNFFLVDSKLYKPLDQYAVLLSKAPEAKAFYDFLFSAKAKEIFKQNLYL